MPAQHRRSVVVLVSAVVMVVAAVMVVARSSVIRSLNPKARISPSLPLTKMWSWAGYSMSLSWFLICKMGIIVVLT